MILTRSLSSFVCVCVCVWGGGGPDAHFSRLFGLCQDTHGEVAELRVECRPLEGEGPKPKSFIHWVSNPLHCTVRMFDRL